MTTWNAVFWPKLWFSLCLVGSLAILKSLFSLSCANTSRLSLFQPMLFCLDQARLVFPYMLYMMTFWCLPLNFSPSIVSDSVIQRQFRIFVKSAQNTDQILDLTAWLSLTGNGQKKKKTLFKVREKSGNIILSQEKLTCWRKVRENWNDLTRLIWYSVLQSNLYM